MHGIAADRGTGGGFPPPAPPPPPLPPPRAKYVYACPPRMTSVGGCDAPLPAAPIDREGGYGHGAGRTRERSRRIVEGVHAGGRRGNVGRLLPPDRLQRGRRAETVGGRGTRHNQGRSGGGDGGGGGGGGGRDGKQRGRSAPPTARWRRWRQRARGEGGASTHGRHSVVTVGSGECEGGRKCPHARAQCQRRRRRAARSGTEGGSPSTAGRSPAWAPPRNEGAGRSCRPRPAGRRRHASGAPAVSRHAPPRAGVGGGASR
ncbi:hypothetical protein BU14_0356s0015, partial [Porphyra umbilicalis]